MPNESDGATGSICRRHTTTDVERDYGAITLEDALRRGVRGMRRQTWIARHFHCWMGVQAFRQFHGRGLGALQTQSHRTGTANGKVALQGAGCGSGQFARLLEGVPQCLIIRRRYPRQQIGMTANELRRRLQRHRGAEVQGPLVLRRREGVVHRDDCPSFAGCGTNRLKVGNAQ